MVDRQKSRNSYFDTISKSSLSSVKLTQKFPVNEKWKVNININNQLKTVEYIPESSDYPSKPMVPSLKTISSKRRRKKGRMPRKEIRSSVPQLPTYQVSPSECKFLQFLYAF